MYRDSFSRILHVSLATQLRVSFDLQWGGSSGRHKNQLIAPMRSSGSTPTRPAWPSLAQPGPASPGLARLPGPAACPPAASPFHRGSASGLPGRRASADGGPSAVARCPMLAALKSHWSSLERSWVVSLAVGRVVHLRWVVFSRLLPLLLPPLPPHRRCVPSLFDGSLCLRPDLYVTHTHKEERGLAASRRTRNMKQNYRYCISRSLPPPPSFPPSLLPSFSPSLPPNSLRSARFNYGESCESSE